MKTKTARTRTATTKTTTSTDTHYADENGMQLCGGEGPKAHGVAEQKRVSCGPCAGRISFPGGRRQQVDTIAVANWANADLDPSERALRGWLAGHLGRRVVAMTYVPEQHSLLVVHEAQ